LQSTLSDVDGQPFVLSELTIHVKYANNHVKRWEV